MKHESYLDDKGITSLTKSIVTKISTIFCPQDSFNTLNNQIDYLKNWEPVSWQPLVEFTDGYGYFDTGISDIADTSLAVTMLGCASVTSAYVVNFNKQTLTIRALRGEEALQGAHHCAISGLIKHT